MDGAEESVQYASRLNFAKSYLSTYNPIPLPSPDTECCICTVSVAENSALPWTSLNCGHKFHAACVTNWMQYKQTCPLCRASITQNGAGRV